MTNSVPLVRDVMQESKVSLLPDMDAFEALDLLVAKKLGGFPVIEADGRLVGFLTLKDCLRLQVIAHEYNMTGRLVRDIMSGINSRLTPDMDILAAAMSFLSCNFLILPVVQSDRLVGSVSRRDLVIAIQKWHRERGHDFKSEKAMQHLVQHPASISEMQNLVNISSNAQLASVFGRRHSDS